MTTVVNFYFRADNSRYPLILLAQRLHCVPPLRCGVPAAIAAADKLQQKAQLFKISVIFAP